MRQTKIANHEATRWNSPETPEKGRVASVGETISKQGRKSGFALVFAAVAAIIPLLTACSKPRAQSNSGVSPSTAPEVPVARIHERNIPLRLEFTGQLSAAHQVEIRPRVSGYVASAGFAEGSIVKAGSVLFEIDPRPFIARHEESKAQVARAQAALDLAQQELARAGRLSEQDAIAREELDRRSADVQSASAALAAATALQAARALDVEFTKVTAPIEGRIGRAHMKPGNLVSGGDANATLLTTLVTESPMHVLFTMDEAAYRQLIALRAKGSPLHAEVRLANGDEIIAGTIDYISNALDPRSGTAQARAVIQNLDGSLAPGLFARVTIVAESAQSRLLVPETALAAEQGNRYVLVLDKENKLSYRRVQLGERRGDERLVLGGLAPGEIIVINGLQKIRPGMTVRPAEGRLASN